MKREMQITHFSKALAIITTMAILLITLTACSTTGTPAVTTSAPAETSSTATEAPTPTAAPACWLGDTPVPISFLYADNPSSPFNKDWLVLQELQKRTNAILTFTVVPDADYENKLKILLGSGDIPDVISKVGNDRIVDFEQNGVMLPISDYMNDLPNFTAMLKNLGPDVQQAVDNLKLKDDNKLYVLPGILEKPTFWSGLFIRSDVLQKYGMSTPKTMDDFYNILKKYKTDNPKSYPFTWQYGADSLYWFMSFAYREYISAWGSPDAVYYDFDLQKYIFAADSDKTKQMIAFIAKLTKEGLLDPELYTQNSDQWVQKMINGTSIATYAWVNNGMTGPIVTGLQKTDPMPRLNGSPSYPAYPVRTAMLKS